MNIRTIALLGGFAAGAALSFAPVAVADDLTSSVDSEIASLNSIFQIDAALANVPSSDYSLVNGYDTILMVDVAKDTPATAPFSSLDYELFGVNPALNVVADPSSLDVLNGAVVDFDDAFNAATYSLLNDSNLIPASDLFGPSDLINTALATHSDAGVFTTFFDAGLADLQGYLGFLPSM